jgi:hypothetical protein
VNSIDISIVSNEVKSEIRSLRLKWSREMVYDLKSFSGFDEKLEKEIMRSLKIEKRKSSIKNIFH